MSGTEAQLEKKTAFLAELGERGSVYHAAKAAGVGRRTVYNWREDDGDFAKAWDDAIEDCVDMVEESLFQRAKKQDTVAAIFFLKNNRAKYRERVEHTGPDGGPIVMVYVPAKDEPKHA